MWQILGKSKDMFSSSRIFQPRRANVSQSKKMSHIHPDLMVLLNRNTARSEDIHLFPPQSRADKQMLTILRHTPNTLTHGRRLRETSLKNSSAERRTICSLAGWGQGRDKEVFFSVSKFTESGFFRALHLWRATFKVYQFACLSSWCKTFPLPQRLKRVFGKSRGTSVI